MGQHTWFVKDKDRHLRMNELWGMLFRYEDDIHILRTQIEEIEEENTATLEYHDLFRTWKRDSEGCYIDDILTKDTYLKWLEDNKDVVSFKHLFDDTAEMEEEYRVYSMKRLQEFFDQYPNGAIYFG